MAVGRCAAGVGRYSPRMVMGIPKSSSEGVAVAPAPEVLVQHFLEQVRLRGKAPALYFRADGRWESISWGEFGTASRRLSAYLIAEGVEAGDHVAIWANNRPEWHIADIGVLSVRGVPVPVYQTLSAEQGGYVLGHSETMVAIVETQALLARVLETRDQLSDLRRIVVMDAVEDASPDGFVISWSEALRRGVALLDDGGDAAVDRRIRESNRDDICTLIYTSGTTGPPKAVQITQRNVLLGVGMVRDLVTCDETDRVISYLPLAHVAERMVSEFRSYVYGNPTWFVTDIGQLGKVLAEVQPTAFFGVPRVWEKMAVQVRKRVRDASLPRRLIAGWGLKVGREYVERSLEGHVDVRLQRRFNRADKLVLSGLRSALGLDQARIMATAAAPISREVLLFFRSLGLEVCEIYGMTENAGCCTLNRPGQSRPGTVGPPAPGVEVRIAEDGEILMRGGVVTPGYYKDPSATGELIDAEGWLHTGDVGELESDGFLKITDRKKDLIITAGGKNISPGNIESVLVHHRLIGSAVAIGDRRPYMSALIALDPEGASAFAHEHGLEADIDALSTNGDLRAEIQRHVDSCNAVFNHVEQVKRFTVLPVAFQVGEELTPTLKIKRKVVTEKYAAQIDAMYAKPRGQG